MCFCCSSTLSLPVLCSPNLFSNRHITFPCYCALGHWNLICSLSSSQITATWMFFKELASFPRMSHPLIHQSEGFVMAGYLWKQWHFLFWTCWHSYFLFPPTGVFWLAKHNYLKMEQNFGHLKPMESAIKFLFVTAFQTHPNYKQLWSYFRSVLSQYMIHFHFFIILFPMLNLLFNEQALHEI